MNRFVSAIRCLFPFRPDRKRQHSDQSNDSRKAASPGGLGCSSNNRDKTRDKGQSAHDDARAMKITPTNQKRINFNGGYIPALKQSIVHGPDHDEREWNRTAEENGSNQPPASRAAQPREDTSYTPGHREAHLHDRRPPVHRQEEAHRKVAAGLEHCGMLDERNVECRAEEHTTAERRD